MKKAPKCGDQGELAVTEMSFFFQRSMVLCGTLAVVCFPALKATVAGAAGSSGAPAGITGRFAVTAQTTVVTAEAIPRPGGIFTAYGQPYIQASSCTSASSCVVVGTYASGPTIPNSDAVPTAPYVDIMADGEWTASPLPTREGFTQEFDSISCVASYCAAVAMGNEGPGLAGMTSFVVVIDGSKILEERLDVSEVWSVSCAAPGACAAAAWGPEGASVLAPTDPTWSATTVTPLPSIGTYDSVNAISCATTDSCTAVGRATGVASSSVGVVYTLSAGTWTVATITGTTRLFGVTCREPTACTAVGTGPFPEPGGVHNEALVVSDNGGRWGIAQFPAPVNEKSSVIVSITCSEAGFCIAEGTLTTNVLYTNSDNGGRWSVTTTPDLYAPSLAGCPTYDQCYMVGWSGSGEFLDTVTFPTSGYREVASDGGVFTFGSATFEGSGAELPLVSPIVGIAVTKDGQGYWLAAADGGVFTYGDAHYYGSMGGTPLRARVVGIAAAPDGGGYWLVAADGGVFSFGDAHFYGSMGGQPLEEPIVGIAVTPTGGGYWEVAADGGVFTFGQAQFFGSTGGIRLNRPIAGLAPTPDGEGYWLVAADGGVFCFGNAHFYGSMGGTGLNAPVVGIAPTVGGTGYTEVASDGGVFTFGDASFYGSMGGVTLEAPVVAVASTH